MNIKIINKDSKQPIPFASVSGIAANGEFLGLGTVASEGGIASINIPNWLNLGVKTITVSSAGYIPESFVLSTELQSYDLELSPSFGGLGEVIVTGIRKTNSAAFIVAVLIAVLTALSLKTK